MKRAISWYNDKGFAFVPAAILWSLVAWVIFMWVTLSGCQGKPRVVIGPSFPMIGAEVETHFQLSKGDYRHVDVVFDRILRVTRLPNNKARYEWTGTPEEAIALLLTVENQQYIYRNKERKQREAGAGTIVGDCIVFKDGKYCKHGCKGAR